MAGKAAGQKRRGPALTGREERWLLNELGELIALIGTERFLNAPLLEPTERFFPDRWEPNAAGVRRLARRLLDYAGLQTVPCEVRLFSLDDAGEDESDILHGHSEDGRVTIAWFREFDDNGVARFGAAKEILNDPEQVVGAMCHEVAHAWRAYHSLRSDEHQLEEKLTDLTTVFLGFGILTANAAYQYRTGSTFTVTGAPAHGWSHTKTGYLSLDQFSFLLAAQVHARQLGYWQRRRIGQHLGANQEGAFRRGLRGVRREREFDYILGLKKTGPGARDSVAASGETKVPDFSRQMSTRTQDRTWIGAAAGGGLGLGIALLLHATFVQQLVCAILVTLTGGLAGRTFRRERCGAKGCGAVLDRDSYFCAHCGAVSVRPS